MATHTTIKVNVSYDVNPQSLNEADVTVTLHDIGDASYFRKWLRSEARILFSSYVRSVKFQEEQAKKKKKI